MSKNDWGVEPSRFLKTKKRALALPISIWEIITLHQKGRIKFNIDIREWVAKATAGTKEAPFTHEMAMAGLELPVNRDPAGRIIAATARVLDLTLITADHRLLELTTINTLANR